MNRPATMLLFAALIAYPIAGAAQDAAAPGHCPQLPAGSGLIWDSRNMGDSDFCRALDANGTEVFGLFISPEPAFKPRGTNRAESSNINGHDIRWYRAEIATQPGVEAREALVELADGRQAHIWLQAPSSADLANGYRTIGQLRFDGGMQIAGND
ncbi:MAG: hypothetical protein M3Y70_03210 [Pseudomonadota bacterium]|nr:hypothetical protein [Pseudomonadota bacterium]